MKEFKARIKPFKEIVERIENFSFSEEENISRLKVKLLLFDGTFLWIWEKSEFQKVVSYSYYWFHSNENLIIGWDNASHHPEIETHPHHKHIGNKIEPSLERNLKEVLSFINAIYNSPANEEK